MRQIITSTATVAALLMLTVLTSCSKDDPAAVDPAKITFASDMDNSPIDSEAGTKTLSFASTQAWIAVVEAGEEWCTIALKTTKAAPSADTKARSAIAGEAGEDVSIIISATENNSYNARNATITITSDDVTKEFLFIQSGIKRQTPVIEITNPASKEVKIDATLDATATVAFNSILAAWKATIKSEDAWCLIEGEAQGEQGTNQSITLKALSANTTAAARTAILTITPENGTATTLTVTQKSATAPVDDILLRIIAPSAVTGISNGTAAEKIVREILPTNVVLITEKSDIQGEVTWITPSITEYNPASITEQTFTVTGVVTLPEGVVNSKPIPLVVAVPVTVNAKEVIPTDDMLLRIIAPNPITGVSNGISAATVLLNLPISVKLITDGDDATATVAWITPPYKDYNPAKESAQTFIVRGTITLPKGVVNTINLSLEVTVSVTVEAKETLPSDDILVSIISPNARSGIKNGTPTATIMSSLPKTVKLLTNGNEAMATVAWITPSFYDYNSASESAQTFTVRGIVTLPKGVVNTNNIRLEANMSISVSSKGTSGGDFEDGGDW